MKHNVRNFIGLTAAIIATCGVFSVDAAPLQNPRGSSTAATTRTNSSVDSRNVQRAATTNTSRATTRGATGRVGARGVITSNAMRDAGIGSRPTARSATVSRAATTPSNVARSATTNGASRARATAVFNDISKIGGGYAACREAYATCMDQFCANANDTYRRCFCSARFNEFRDTASALDEAKTLLMQFDDNINAIDKTAAEVDAMYSATVGEKAIKTDKSKATDILSQIGDLLSGKKTTTTDTTGSTRSSDSSSYEISSDVDDVWGDNDSYVFGGNSKATSLADLEGIALYNASNRQCVSVIGDVCANDAVFQMARSSYSILISQDCNAYEKKIKSQRESVKQTVRTAEKYLREARLDEYRSHNSADVNECIDKVRSAITADTACGSNYKRCLDRGTGAYINPATGDALYTGRLFQLTGLITLDSAKSDTDVLKQNPTFDKYLDSKRMYATSALDTCRDIADDVWVEFKRSALIEIAQAQDEKIEEVKMSCISTMAECYDTQTSALRDFDDASAQMVGAVSRYAARALCSDKVSACATLYGGAEQCSFDGNGKLQNQDRCGLTALLDFVDTVDNVRIASSCESALQKVANDLCTPASGEIVYPWKCRSLSVAEITKQLKSAEKTYCLSDKTNVDSTTVINNLVSNIRAEMADLMYEQCKSVSGKWYDSYNVLSNKLYESKFYTMLYGSNVPPEGKNIDTDYGVCVRNTVKDSCDAQDALTGNNGYATYNETSDSCVLSTEWYQFKCENVLNGYWNNGICYTKGN